MEYEFLQFYTIYPGNRPPRFHPVLFPMILQGIQALKNAFEHLFRCNISKKDLLTPQAYTHILFQIINLKCSGSFVPAPSTIGYSRNPATKPSTVAKADTKTYDLSTGKSGKCCQFTPSHRHIVRSCFKKAKSFTIPSSGQITQGPCLFFFLTILSYLIPTRTTHLWSVLPLFYITWCQMAGDFSQH